MTGRNTPSVSVYLAPHLEALRRPPADPQAHSHWQIHPIRRAGTPTMERVRQHVASDHRPGADERVFADRPATDDGRVRPITCPASPASGGTPISGTRPCGLKTSACNMRSRRYSMSSSAALDFLGHRHVVPGSRRCRRLIRVVLVASPRDRLRSPSARSTAPPITWLKCQILVPLPITAPSST